MKDVIYSSLKPVRGRQQTQFAVRCAVAGLSVGAGVGVALGIGRLAFGLQLSSPASVAALVAGPVIGLIYGLVSRRGWHDAAAAVDTHYDLKDRTVSALAFVDQADKGALHDLQIADTIGKLGTVEPKSVVPLKAPRSWGLAVLGTAVAVAMLFWPAATPTLDAAPSPTPEHVASAASDLKAKIAALNKKLAETTQDLEDEKAAEEKKALEEAVKKLEEKVEELNRPNVNEREALARLSEMQTEMQNLANQLNVAAMDGQLSSLGSALAATQAFEGAGKALQDGKLEKAVRELEKLEDVKLTPKEAKALEEKLKQLQKQMGDAGQGSLSEAVGELAENLRGGNGKVGKASKNVARAVNNAIKRKKANELLNDANEEVKDCKCQCQNNGGDRKKQVTRSDSPSGNWGRGISGNVDGEKTRLAGKRNDLQLTGTPGAEGESDIETTATPEARQQASREYKEKYEKAKKAAESVVEGEPIPLGMRQMVKKYFESIRPTGTEEATQPTKKGDTDE